MNYNIESLVESLKYEFSDEYIAFKDYQFRYDDCIVSVTGNIQEHYSWISGDYFTEPYAVFEYRIAEIEEVVLSYDYEKEYDLTVEEIDYIEKQLEKE